MVLRLYFYNERTTAIYPNRLSSKRNLLLFVILFLNRKSINNQSVGGGAESHRHRLIDNRLEW